MAARENKITFYMSEEQKADLEKRASRSGLTVSNYLRSLLGWPLERQGERKDLITKQAKTLRKRRG